MRSRFSRLFVSFLLFFAFSGFTRASTACGYYGPIAKEIENSFDKCYTDNVKESRLRMSVGFEHCFGYDWRLLNSTVGGPFEKKKSDTQSTLLHLSDTVCSDNEDALNEFILSSDSSLGIDEGLAEKGVVASEPNINNCKAFFDIIVDAVGQANFQIATLMKANEKRLSGLFPNEKTRQKVFLVVVNIVKPMAVCHQPMLELRMRLLKKYLKRFLMDQISPAVPAFSGKTLPVVTHPEIFVSYKAVTQKTSESPEDAFDWNAKRVHGLTIAPKKVVKIEQRPTSTLTDRQKDRVIAFDVANQNKPLEQRDWELTQAIRDGKITDTQFLAMTPQQRLEANLLTRKDFVSQVALPEDHGHFTAPVEIDNVWNPEITMKDKGITEKDFDRYKIKGFDVDNKIERLFGKRR